MPHIAKKVLAIYIYMPLNLYYINGLNKFKFEHMQIGLNYIYPIKTLNIILKKIIKKEMTECCNLFSKLNIKLI
jgi:hypothetical protein